MERAIPGVSSLALKKSNKMNFKEPVTDCENINWVRLKSDDGEQQEIGTEWENPLHTFIILGIFTILWKASIKACNLLTYSTKYHTGLLFKSTWYSQWKRKCYIIVGTLRMQLC